MISARRDQRSAPATRSGPRPIGPSGPIDSNPTMLWARAIAEELQRSGVVTVALCPGSRSGPLAIAIDRLLEASVHLDERSAAFFALGAAKASGRPAAVVVTSGTAAANLLPAAAEARAAGVPLVLLTADRPVELRGCGARQTIDQTDILGRQALATFDLPMPEPRGAVLRGVRAAVSRLVQVAAGSPPGPVHLNVPLREPLDSRLDADGGPGRLAAADPLAFDGRPGRPFVRVLREPARGDGPIAEAVAAHARSGTDAVIVAGRSPGAHREVAEAAACLAAATGWPVLADPCSGLRSGNAAGVGRVDLVTAHDAFLRDDRVAAALAPDLVVRIGAPPISKHLARWIERHARTTDLIVIDPDGRASDPEHLGATVLVADPLALAQSVAARLDRSVADRASRSSLAKAIRRANAAARSELDRHAGGSLTEAAVVSALGRALPDGALLFVGSGIAIRALDTFLAPRAGELVVMMNGGANGIDGTVSAAIGATAARGGRGVLLIGDLGLLHDAGGLRALSPGGAPPLDLTIVAVNNDGGGIFEHLPAREHEPRFEALFATPHGRDLAGAAALGGLPHGKVTSTAELHRALARSLAASGPELIEVVVDRAESRARLTRAWSNAAAAAARAMARSSEGSER